MEQIIRNMIVKAQYYMNEDKEIEAYEWLDFAKELIETMSETINCPSNWRNIGQKLESYYDFDSWVYNELELWNYINE